MKREKTTIRMPAELKKEIQQAADEKGYLKQTTLRIDTGLHNELKIVAEQMGLTFNSLLLVAIWRSVLKTKGLPL